MSVQSYNTYKPRFIKTESNTITTPNTSQSASQLYITTNTTPNAAGSSYIEYNTIKLYCSIYGPTQSYKSTHNNLGVPKLDFRYISFSQSINRVDTKRNYITAEKQLTKQLYDIVWNIIDLKQYNTQQLQLYIQCIDCGSHTDIVLHNNILMTSINALIAALYNANIILISRVSAVQLYYDTKARQYTDQHNDNTADLSIVYALDTQQILHIQLVGCSNIDDIMYDNILSHAIQQCDNVANIIQDTVKELT